MITHIQTSPDAPWKRRYRAPVIWDTQIAELAPGCGLAAGTQTGTLQWYAWEVSTGSLRQLTDRPKGMATYLILSPDGEFVYYHDDQGVGNEIGHFVRIPYQGGEAVDLTPDLPPYSSFGFSICRSGKRLGFLVAGSDGYTICSAEIKAGGELGPRKKIYHSTKICFGPSFSCDGDVAVVMSSEHTDRAQFKLLAFELSSGEKMAELWDGEGTSLEISAPSPVPGEARFLATTNRSGIETLLVWDPRTGERTDLTFKLAGGSEISGAVTGASWSPDGKKVLFTIFHQALQQLYLYDLISGQTNALQAPVGLNNNTYFTPDGEKIVSIWEDSTQPPQVIALHPETGEKTATLLKASGGKETGDLPPGIGWKWVNFPSAGGQMIQGWLGIPEGSRPFPLVLETHGGPHGVTPNSFSPGAQAWLEHGFAFLTINYRGSTTFGRDFQEAIWNDLGHWEVEDMVAARQWLVELGIADPNKVFLTGWSYGGYLTLQALGMYPELWAGGLAGIAIADWAVQYEDTADTLRGFQVALLGGTPQEKPEQYAKSSPVTYAGQVKAPVLIIQGRNDTRTPARPVEMYEAKLKALGKPIEVVWFDSGHAGSGSDIEQSIGFQEKMMEFATQILKKETPPAKGH
jgi:dipeptidyl aminopeptidase/acylaminoacyl peptidase